jgi:hypothetical protein|nr:MAG TPA: hypothetical protein [Caudoviricetes sp.]
MKINKVYFNNLAKELDVIIGSYMGETKDIFWLMHIAKLTSSVYLYQRFVGHPIKMSEMYIFIHGLVEEIVGRSIEGCVLPDENYYSKVELKHNKLDEIYGIIVGIKVRAGYQGKTEELMHRIGKFVGENMP